MERLVRRKDSGLVPFPKHWPHRILGGRATYQTKCDLLVGPCSCLMTHLEYQEDTKYLLREFDAEIEPLVLRPKSNGSILVPLYWEASEHMPGTAHTHLVGACSCGRTHTGNEPWVRLLLDKHIAVFA
jgi:hypothetical protein